jgi:hypothetical protein
MLQRLSRLRYHLYHQLLQQLLAVSMFAVSGNLAVLMHALLIVRSLLASSIHQEKGAKVPRQNTAACHVITILVISVGAHARTTSSQLSQMSAGIQCLRLRSLMRTMTMTATGEIGKEMIQVQQVMVTRIFLCLGTKTKEDGTTRLTTQFQIRHQHHHAQQQ